MNLKVAPPPSVGSTHRRPPWASMMVREIDSHREAMEQQGLDIEQTRLDLAWLERVKAFKAT